MRIQPHVLFLLILPLCLPASTSAQAILQSAKEGDLTEVRRILGQDPEAVYTMDSRSCTALHFAVQGGHAELVALLLDHHADANLQDYDGHAPLHWAVLYGQEEMVEQLLGFGVEPDLRDDYGRTPLLLAARETGSEVSARTLLEGGADPDALDRFGTSSLNLAAWRGFEGVVDALLDFGSDLGVERGEGAKTLEFATQKGLERLFRALVQAGVGLDGRTENGGSLLHAAAEGGSEEIVTHFLDFGFDVAERDRYGWTPLHYAAERGRKGASEVLISRGAEVSAASIGGHTPLSVTRTYGKVEEAELLKAHGAESEAGTDSGRTGPWMGQGLPGSEPVLFAPDVVSSSRFEHGTVTFSPDGTEAFWSSSFMPNETGYSRGRILTARLEKGGWAQPDYASFSRSFMTGDDVPFFHPNGEKLYFDSRRPQEGMADGGRERLWVVERTSAGWGAPDLIEGGPNTLGIHWQFSVASNGNIYVGSADPGGFGGGDIYVSRFVDGSYLAPENLGPTINSEAGEDSPFIAPDESYIIFTSMDRPDGLGGTDLYISFKDSEGEWTRPLNLGSPINTTTNDMCPMVSGDGPFLFWNSRPEGNADNYWMDAGVIEELRARVLGG